jgi:hypothetical protein
VKQRATISRRPSAILLSRPLLLEQSDTSVFVITLAVCIRIDRRAVFIFVIVLDAECAAQFFGQRRLAEQARLFEPVEVGQIAQAGQSHSARNAGVVT